MPRKRLFNRLEHERDLGLLPRMARAAQLPGFRAMEEYILWG
jgi:hypothetical protein